MVLLMPEDAAARQSLLLKGLLPLGRFLPCGRKASSTTKKVRLSIPGISTVTNKTK